MILGRRACLISLVVVLLSASTLSSCAFHVPSGRRRVVSLFVSSTPIREQQQQDEAKDDDGSKDKRERPHSSVASKVGAKAVAVDAMKENKEIAHLQKKLRYWKKQQNSKESAYHDYVHGQMVQQKLKPIYERQGKIDTYRIRPVFDQETERIQTEIWSIKEKIKLTSAKLQEEWRVQRVRQETTQRMIDNEADIVRLTDELQVLETKNKVHQLFRRKAKVLRGQLANAKQEREQIQMQAESSLANLQNEYATSMETIKDESSKRLSEKEQEIDSLAEEIHGLIVGLKEKRQELGVKNSVITQLESELQEKESTLMKLSRERESLRSLVRQSWRVLKARLFKKRGGSKKKKNKHNKNKTTTTASKDDDNDKGLQPAVGQEEKEKVLVGK